MKATTFRNVNCKAHPHSCFYSSHIHTFSFPSIQEEAQSQIFPSINIYAVEASLHRLRVSVSPKEK